MRKRIGGCAVGAVLGCAPEEAFDPGCEGRDRPCVRNMCLACDDLGGSLLLLEKSGEWVCSDRETGFRLDLDDADFCREPYCEDTRVPMDLTMLDPAGSEMLEIVDGVHTQTLTWFPHGTGRLQSVDPPVETSTEITVEQPDQARVPRR